MGNLGRETFMKHIPRDLGVRPELTVGVPAEHELDRHHKYLDGWKVDDVGK
jgi:hypothetical protein